MVLIGIYCLVELLMFIILAFLVFFLLNAVQADIYKAVIGYKPFEKQPFVTKSVTNPSGQIVDEEVENQLEED
jgi:hypothetical protein